MALFLRPPGEAGWQSCDPGQVTWLDRGLLSSGRDRTLHRAPRCPGLRLVDEQWELFNRDVTHRVYVAPQTGRPGYQVVQAAARHELPAASAHYEPLPIQLETGAWLVSVGEWVLALRVEAVPAAAGQATPDDPVPTDYEQVGGGRPAWHPPVPDAAARVTTFFTQNPRAQMAIAYYYQEFIVGAAAPQEIPMPVVAAALNLTGQGTVSDYKRKLQDCIWNEQGHQRELGEFLLSNNLINRAHVEQARRVALDNEERGDADLARERFKYRSAR